MKELLKDQNEWLKDLSRMRQRPNSYFVLDVQKLLKEDKRNLELCINMMDAAQTTAIFNAMSKSVGGSKKIDASIIYEAMNALLNSRSFTEKQLKKYFDFLAEFIHLQNSLVRLNRDIEDIWIDPDTGLLLLGYTHDQIEKIYNWSSDKLHVEEYWELQGCYDNNEIDFKIFLDKAKKILNTILEGPQEKAA